MTSASDPRFFLVGIVELGVNSIDGDVSSSVSISASYDVEGCWHDFLAMGCVVDFFAMRADRS